MDTLAHEYLTGEVEGMKRMAQRYFARASSALRYAIEQLPDTISVVRCERIFEPDGNYCEVQYKHGFQNGGRWVSRSELPAQVKTRHRETIEMIEYFADIVTEHDPSKREVHRR